MPDYREAFENNRKWAEEKIATDKDFFRFLALAQNPDYFFLACCDSRVAPEVLTGADPGDMFVHRNIANQMVSGEFSSEAALSFAVLTLKVKYIVVCGHYGCGGILAAMDGEKHGAMEPWLNNIRELFNKNLPELSLIKEEGTRIDRFIELNVFEQCRRIRNSAIMDEARQGGFEPAVYGWIYDMSTGLLRDLEV